jgi:predicted nucleotidyltransferase component of viral defense system
MFFEDRLNNYGITEISQSTKNILISSVNNIKVDFVNYNYPLLKPYKTIENVRLAFLEDIAAMKLNAIMGRGSKKDFIDLYFLLKKFSLKEIFDFYTDKYTDGSKFLVLKSLVYFTDADVQLQPKMYLDFNWEICKQKIIQEVLKL